jgi:hypothetical protein
MAITPGRLGPTGEAFLSAAGDVSAARKYGAVQAGPDQGLAYARRRRAQQLAQLIQQGKIKSADLGPNDRALVADAGTPTPSFPTPNPPGGGFFKGVGGFFTHLGSDIYNTGKYLVPGIVRSVGSLGHDVYEDFAHPLERPHIGTDASGRKSAFRHNVIDPTLQSYGQTYGHGPGHFFHEFYQHPLGPILDVASLASLGLSGVARSGSVVARTAEPGSTSARLATRATEFTSREGRAPLITDVGREIPREYTPRPIPRLAQRHILDPLGQKVDPLGRLQLRTEERRQARLKLADSQHERYQVLADTPELQRALAKLDGKPAEQQALTFLHLGVNSAKRIAEFEKMVKEGALSNEEELHILEAQGISPKYLEHHADLPQEVKDRILDPSEAMIEIHRLWKDRVDRLTTEAGIDPEAHAAHVAEPQKILDRRLEGDAEDPLPHPGFPIEPTYVPLDPATGFEPAQGFRMAEGAFTRPRDRFLQRAVGLTTPPRERARATSETAFIQRDPKYLHESQFETFRAGTFRTDSKAYLDHVTQRARDVAEQHFKGGALQRIAMKDPETGELLKVRNLTDASDPVTRKALLAMQRRGIRPEDVTVVNDGFTVQWFRKQFDHLQEVRRVVNEFTKDLPDDAEIADLLKDDHLEQLLSQITEADTKAFVTHSWNAAKRKGYIVPKAEARYHAKIANLDLPQTNPILRFIGTWMNRWRGALLTAMPRWWINTAAGSLLMNTVQGVDFHDYWLAGRMSKAGLIPEKVNLGHQPLVEYSDAARYGENMMPSLPTQRIQGMVQGIENYFRRASFVHAMKRESRLARDHTGRHVDVEADAPQALENIGETLNEHFDTVLKEKRGNIAEALDDPKVVERSLQEVNKFSYNYGILGPDERKYVRNFIPFWGWYKFISMAAYRLPVEMPARVNAMRFLSQIAAEHEGQMGSIPDWVKGAIPISLGGGKYTYLSTQGINPFSQFFNPVGPQGALFGSLQPGQLNPGIQALLGAAGFDTLGGGGVRISPESGLGTDFLGRLIDENTGQPANIGEHEAGWRLLHSLLFSLPQARFGVADPRGEFPESVPILHERPLPGDPKPPPFAGQPGWVNLLAQYTGLAPKHYNLSSQITAAKGSQYVKKKNAKARLRTQ